MKALTATVLLLLVPAGLTLHAVAATPAGLQGLDPNAFLAERRGPMEPHPTLFDVEYQTYRTTCTQFPECVEIAESLTRNSANLALEESRRQTARAGFEAMQWEIDYTRSRMEEESPLAPERAELWLQVLAGYEGRQQEYGEAWDEASNWVNLLKNRMDNLARNLAECEAACSAADSPDVDDPMPLSVYFDDPEPHLGDRPVDGHGRAWQRYVTLCPSDVECRNILFNLNATSRDLTDARVGAEEAEYDAAWRQQLIDRTMAALLEDRVPADGTRVSAQALMAKLRQEMAEARAEAERLAELIPELEQEIQRLLAALAEAETECLDRSATILWAQPFFVPGEVDSVINDPDNPLAEPDDGYIIIDFPPVDPLPPIDPTPPPPNQPPPNQPPPNQPPPNEPPPNQPPPNQPPPNQPPPNQPPPNPPPPDTPVPPTSFCPGDFREGLFNGNGRCGVVRLELSCPGDGSVIMRSSETTFVCDEQGFCGDDNLILGALGHTVRAILQRGADFRLDARNNNTNGQCSEAFVGVLGQR